MKKGVKKKKKKKKIDLGDLASPTRTGRVLIYYLFFYFFLSKGINTTMPLLSSCLRF
jgi:hypothetical protein